MSHNPLGKQTDYVSEYAPALLFPIARADSRALLNISQQLPFHGEDSWTAYELSWLDKRGKPVVAAAEFRIPCSSEFMVESKSFKLYLNSFNQTRLTDLSEVKALLHRDLSAVICADLEIDLYPLNSAASPLAAIQTFPGECLDDLPVDTDIYQPHPDFLEVGEGHAEESLFSHLLKTNCPVTGQPDWASICIDYRGRTLAREGLLRYLISFREHQDFHEHCVERIFTDIMERCQPDALTVVARYTRRGGLDINPLRTTEATLPRNLSRRLLRQ